MDQHQNQHDDDPGRFIIRSRGLPWSASPQDIMNFFKDCSIKGELEGIHMTYNRDGRQSGEAYVEFENELDLKIALTKHNDHMGRRYVEVFKAKSSEMDWVVKRSSMPRGGTSGDAVVRLRGLPFGCSKEEIAQFFTGLEIVPNGITLPVDSNGRTTGDAYVQFSSQEIADKAALKHKEMIGHRYIEIFKSSLIEIKKSLSGGGNVPRLMGGNMGGRSAMGRPGPYDRSDRYGGGMGMGMGNMAAMRARRMKMLSGYFDDEYDDEFMGMGMGGMGMGMGMGQMNRMRKMAAMNSGMGMGGGRKMGGMGSGSDGGGGGNQKSAPGSNYVSETGHAVHMRGLPFQANEQDIIDFFNPATPVNIEMLYNRQGKSMGEADVDFATHEEAQEAMKKDRSNMQHRYIELFLNSTPDDPNNMSMNSGMGSMGAMGGMSNMSNDMGGNNMSGNMAGMGMNMGMGSNYTAF